MKKYLFFSMLLVSSFLQAQTAVPYLQKNGKYIFVDSATMKPIINAQEFDYASELHGGFWDIGILKPYNGQGYKEYRHGLYSKFGKALTEFSFESLYVLDKNFSIILFAKDNKYGLMDSKGKQILESKYDQINFNNINDDIHLVNSNGKCGFINNAGKEVIACTYATAYNFQDGLALVSNVKNDYDFEHGFYIDKTGKTVLKPKIPNIESLSPFSEGIASFTVKNNKHQGTIDKTGKVILKPIHHSIFPFNDGVAIFIKSKGALNDLLKGGEKFGLLDKMGNIIVQAKYDDMTRIFKDRYLVELDGQFGVINMKGNQIIPFIYNKLLKLNDNASKFLALKKDEFQIIDATGRVTSAFKNNYDNLIPYGENIFMVVKDGKYGFINSRAELIIPIQYGRYDLWFKNFIGAKNANGSTSFFDKTGREYAEN